VWYFLQGIALFESMVETAGHVVSLLSQSMDYAFILQVGEQRLWTVSILVSP
jgi:hypothetical protein